MNEDQKRILREKLSDERQVRAQRARTPKKGFREKTVVFSLSAQTSSMRKEKEQRPAAGGER